MGAPGQPQALTPEFSFTVELDGARRAFSLPLRDRARADLYARRTLDLLTGIGALRNGSVAVEERAGEEVRPVGVWIVSAGGTPVRAPVAVLQA